MKNNTVAKVEYFIKVEIEIAVEVEVEGRKEVLSYYFFFFLFPASLPFSSPVVSLLIH